MATELTLKQEVKLTRDDDYWKLPTYTDLTPRELKAKLAEKNYKPGTQNDIDGLIWHLQCAERGLLSYVPFSNEQLRELIRSRGIETDFKGSLGTRPELLMALEHEDRHPKFHKFMSLPPELRSRVYEFYFAGFSKRPHAPKQPPLTLTSSLVRQESLPLFYSKCTFEFNLLQLLDYTRRQPRSAKLVIPDTFLLWMHSTDPKNLRDIQHIVVNACRGTSVDGANTKLLSFSIANPKTTGESLLSFGRVTEGINRGYKVMKLMDMVLEDYNGNEGWELKKDDYFKIRQWVEWALKKR